MSGNHLRNDAAYADNPSMATNGLASKIHSTTLGDFHYLNRQVLEPPSNWQPRYGVIHNDDTHLFQNVPALQDEMDKVEHANEVSEAFGCSFNIVNQVGPGTGTTCQAASVPVLLADAQDGIWGRSLKAADMLPARKRVHDEFNFDALPPDAESVASSFTVTPAPPNAPLSKKLRVTCKEDEPGLSSEPPDLNVMELDEFEPPSIATALVPLTAFNSEYSGRSQRLLELDAFLWSQVRMEETSESTGTCMQAYRAICEQLRQLVVTCDPNDAVSSSLLSTGLEEASKEMRELTIRMVATEEEEEQHRLGKTKQKSSTGKSFVSLYMRHWLREHWVHPYPDALEIEYMADVCGVRGPVLENWIANARSRHWRETVVQALAQERPMDLFLEDCIRLFDNASLRDYTRQEEASWEHSRQERLEENTTLPAHRAQEARVQAKAVAKAKRNKGGSKPK